ncbi:MAG TPA: cytochrome c peroxidase [Myxococcota bacterium]|nr:cytochrome c peroxidase [Myxococcota bacterium]
MHRITLALLLAACSGGQPEKKPEAPKPAPEAPKPPPEPPKPAIPEAHTALFKALEKAKPNPADKAKIDLGRMLYYDTRLSAANDISCNSCHMLDAFGVDHQPTSPGHKGQRGARNSPTTLNAFLQFVQFWDGRAADVEAQAQGPVLNPVEMAMADAKAVEAALSAVPAYKDAFTAAFPGQESPVTFNNMASAIGAFERNLVTPGRFDAYLKGDATALTADEKAGLELFISTGCTSCHNGVLVGGSSFQKLGAVVPYETKDQGRFEVTKNDNDKLMFKVPSLRNIDKTGPYFHDGSVATLEEAVQKMGKHQLGKDLSPSEIGSIVTFLKALTGEVDASYVAKPELPPAAPKK